MSVLDIVVVRVIRVNDYDNGVVKAERKRMNGRKSGVWTFYYPDGTLSSRSLGYVGRLNATLSGSERKLGSLSKDTKPMDSTWSLSGY